MMEVTGSLTRLSNEVQGSEARLKALETLLLDRRLSDAVTPAGWPADGGFVSSGFGQRADPFTGELAYHEGVDIASRQQFAQVAVGRAPDNEVLCEHDASGKADPGSQMNELLSCHRPAPVGLRWFIAYTGAKIMLRSTVKAAPTAIATPYGTV